MLVVLRQNFPVRSYEKTYNLAGNGLSLYIRNVLIVMVLVDIDNAPLPAR